MSESSVPLIDFLAEKLEASYREHLTEAAKAKRAMKQVEKLTPSDPLMFHILIESMWEREGEENVSLQKKGTLEEVLAAAEKKFMELNDRDDIRADYFVYVAIEKSDIRIPIDERHWRHLKHGERRRQRRTA